MMIIKSCISCKFHEIKQDGKRGDESLSEGELLVTILQMHLSKALEKYLKEESSRPDRSFTSLN
jgi:hypothetical protein